MSTTAAAVRKIGNDLIKRGKLLCKLADEIETIEVDRQQLDLLLQWERCNGRERSEFLAHLVKNDARGLLDALKAEGAA